LEFVVNDGIKPIGDIDFTRRIQARLAELESELPEEEFVDVVVYDCDVCSDKGIIIPDLPVHDPAYGKVVECPRVCVTVRKNRRDRVERMLTGMKARTIRPPR
jgi:hypothetical protein